MATHVTLYFSAAPAGVTNAITDPRFSGDTKVLNFALALETLEAELYRQAYARLTGSTYDGSQPVDQFGGDHQRRRRRAVHGPDVLYLAEFGKVETQHRQFLKSALGGNYVVTAGLKFDFGINSLSRLQVRPARLCRGTDRHQRLSWRRGAGRISCPAARTWLTRRLSSAPRRGIRRPSPSF